ncbi:MAG: universal stress protein [Acidobacteria bacterium]|nr:universal stress protein [Acidobacteriota bacterium]
MFSHLAVGIDGSAAADAALDLTLQLATKLGSVVHGIHVIDTAILEGSFITDVSGALGVEPLLNLTPQVQELLGDLGETLRERFNARAEESAVRGRFHLVRGAVAYTLVEESASSALLVVGRRGLNERFHGELLGPVTERLLRVSTIPVLVSSKETGPLAHILIALDNGQRARHALRWGGELARALEAGVTLVHADGESGDGQQLLQNALDYLRPLEIEVDTRLESGNPVKAIERVAAECSADLICMGSHTHSRLIEMVLGSTTEAILRRLDTAVMCVP